MTDKETKKLDLKEVEKGAQLKKTKAPETGISPQTKVLGAVKKGTQLKKVEKPTEGLSEAEKKAYLEAKKNKK
eukprot:CAMPEP_0114499696 /NCGR_PEP_ID=MMETSP0109-20121206/7561_1 /TAXON_ID=29199 /ORGANISM="Chlorarachnion reptans, Strain CCCM449" /LENGTH=72 /DNA_ID=CAMNT_0001677293 /DNA_START=135 /DNA_END=350 /DNA_ORIENTATION=+